MEQSITGKKIFNKLKLKASQVEKKKLREKTILIAITLQQGFYSIELEDRIRLIKKRLIKKVNRRNHYYYYSYYYHY